MRVVSPHTHPSAPPPFPDLAVEQPVPEPGGGAAGSSGGTGLQDSECGANRTHFGGLQHGAGAGTGQSGGAGRLVRRALQGESLSVSLEHYWGQGEGCRVIG